MLALVPKYMFCNLFGEVFLKAKGATTKTIGTPMIAALIYFYDEYLQLINLYQNDERIPTALLEWNFFPLQTFYYSPLLDDFLIPFKNNLHQENSVSKNVF